MAQHVCIDLTGEDESPSQPRTLRSNSQVVTPKPADYRVTMFTCIFQDVFALAAMEMRIRPDRKALAYGSLLPKWTDAVGNYLMDLGFPLIGIGSLSLCFLITEEYVIKVPKIAKHECIAGDDRSYRLCPACLHNAERGRDLGMSKAYPNGFAKTDLTYIDLTTSYGRPYRVTFQERLYGPFERHGIPPHLLAKQPNADELRELALHNPDVKQYARRKDGTLVYFDYQ